MNSNQIRFGTDGWRALIAKEFTFDNARIVVQAVADYVTEQGQQIQGIVIGFDTRFLADSFARMAAEVMTGNNVQVFLTDKPTPTPVIAHAVKQHDAAGAIVFTASHNSADYMGLKFIPDYAGPASAKITKRLEELIAQIQEKGRIKSLSFETAMQTGRITMSRPDGRYKKALHSLVDLSVIRERGLKAAVDPMYGAGMGYVGGMLQEAGCDVVSLHDWRDPLFGGSMPEPTDAHLGELKAAVVANGLQLGLANDGDADRFGVIDETGAYLSPNLVMALLLFHLVTNRKQQGIVVRTVATSHLIDRIAESFGLSVHETPVGFKYIGEYMRNHDVLIGGEESGGLSIQGHLPEKDGILADLLMAEFCAVEGKPLSRMVEDLYKLYGRLYAKRLDLKVTEERKAVLLAGFIEQPLQEIAGIRVDHVVTIDGFKFLLEDGSWVLVRPSGTEPLLRVYAEASSEEQLEALAFAMKQLIHAGSAVLR